MYSGPHTVLPLRAGLRLCHTPGLKLFWSAAHQAHLLIAPNGTIQLNAFASDLLALCDGLRTVDEVIDAAQPGATTAPRHEIEAFLQHALEQRWLIPITTR